MIDPDSDIAEKLAQALLHHQKNAAENEKAKQKVEMLEQMIAKLKELKANSGGGS